MCDNHLGISCVYDDEWINDDDDDDDDRCWFCILYYVATVSPDTSKTPSSIALVDLRCSDDKPKSAWLVFGKLWYQTGWNRVMYILSELSTITGRRFTTLIRGQQKLELTESSFSAFSPRGTLSCVGSSHGFTKPNLYRIN